MSNDKDSTNTSGDDTSPGTAKAKADRAPKGAAPPPPQRGDRVVPGDNFDREATDAALKARDLRLADDPERPGGFIVEDVSI